MVKIGKKIIYRDEVCVLVDIAKAYRDGEDYYIMQSSADPSLSIKAPVKTATEFVRLPMSKGEIRELVKMIPDIEPVELATGAKGTDYKDLIESGTHQDLLRVIKTAYLRRQQLSGHRPNEKDKTYFRQAEKRLYSELACVLDVSLEEAKDAIVSQVKSSIASSSPDTLVLAPAL